MANNRPIEPVVALLGQAGDEVSLRIAHHLQARGTEVVHASGLNGLDVWVEMSRSGCTKSSIRYSQTGAEIYAFVNRGAYSPGEDKRFGADEEFIKSESLAVMWAMLAEFPGRVVNRPGVLGPFEVFDTKLTDAPVACISTNWPRRSENATFASIAEDGYIVNAHNLVDGRLVGRGSAQGAKISCEIPTRFTVFDPSNVVRLLITPTETIDLATGLSPKLQASRLNLRRDDATREGCFVVVVCEQVDSELRLLQLQRFPHISALGKWADKACRQVADWVRA